MDLRTHGMAARIECAAEHYEIYATGDVDLQDAVTLAQYLIALAERGPPRLIIDLAGIRYFGCSALNALMNASKVAAGLGGFVYMTGASSAVHRILDLTGTTKIVTDRDWVLTVWPEAPI